MMQKVAMHSGHMVSIATWFGMGNKLVSSLLASMYTN